MLNQTDHEQRIFQLPCVYRLKRHVLNWYVMVLIFLVDICLLEDRDDVGMFLTTRDATDNCIA